MAVTTGETVAGLEVQDGIGIAQSDTQQVSSGKGKKQGQSQTVSNIGSKLRIRGGGGAGVRQGKEGSQCSLGIDQRESFHGGRKMSKRHQSTKARIWMQVQRVLVRLSHPRPVVLCLSLRTSG